MSRIAFIGLGNMGLPMAKNLVKAGERVTVFDLVASAMSEAEQAGADSVLSAKEAVKNADIVISMLPAAKHVETLYLGDDGVAQSLTKGCLVIDCSTIDAATSRKLATGLQTFDVDCIDAPVSGGTTGASAGTLTFIVGGSDQAYLRATPVLEKMGKNVFHAGDNGAGQIAKICNNMLLAIQMAGTAEALQMAIDNGLDPKVMSNIMLESSGSNWCLEKYNPCPGVMENVPSSNHYQGGFMVELMKKDLTLAADAALASNSTTPMGALAQNLYRLHLLAGNGKRDFSSIFQMFSNSKAN